ncbi:MAG: hypothetical protein LV481_04650 [Methylacidiphilales bacterium]|nr:hypothetical protein [Candidatus Methylacidiphilales bacterium]
MAKLHRPASPGKPVELFPTTVELLRSRGVTFDWRRPEHDLILTCPICGGKAAVHENEPWFYCGGDIRCRTRSMGFEQVVEALAQKAEDRP